MSGQKQIQLLLLLGVSILVLEAVVIHIERQNSELQATILRILVRQDRELKAHMEMILVMARQDRELKDFSHMERILEIKPSRISILQTPQDQK